MGYDTTYSLKCDKRYDEINEYLKENHEAYQNVYYSFGTTHETKWYEHVEDMKRFSKLFPDVLFILEGDGEDPEDLWIKYFFNGKVQLAMAKISYAKFDKNKLKDYEI